MSDLLRHESGQTFRTKKARLLNLEVRGNAQFGVVSTTSLTANSLTTDSLSASNASFATMTAIEATIGTLTVTTIITASASIPGLIVQIVEDDFSAVNTGTASISEVDVTPAASDGTLFMSATISPIAVGTHLVTDIQALLASSVNSKVTGTIGYGTATSVVMVGIVEMAAVNNSGTLRLSFHTITTATTPQIYNFRAGSNAGGTTTFNGDSGARLFGSVTKSWIRIEEKTTKI